MNRTGDVVSEALDIIVNYPHLPLAFHYSPKLRVWRVRSQGRLRLGIDNRLSLDGCGSFIYILGNEIIKGGSWAALVEVIGAITSRQPIA